MKQLEIHMQGVPTKVICCVCHKPVKTDRFMIDRFKYTCSEKCYEEATE